MHPPLQPSVVVRFVRQLPRYKRLLSIVAVATGAFQLFGLTSAALQLLVSGSEGLQHVLPAVVLGIMLGLVLQVSLGAVSGPRVSHCCRCTRHGLQPVHGHTSPSLRAGSAERTPQVSRAQHTPIPDSRRCVRLEESGGGGRWGGGSLHAG